MIERVTLVNYPLLLIFVKSFHLLELLRSGLRRQHIQQVPAELAMQLPTYLAKQSNAGALLLCKTARSVSIDQLFETYHYVGS